MGDIIDPLGFHRFLSWVLHTKMHGANPEACKKNRSSRLGLQFCPTYLSNGLKQFGLLPAFCEVHHQTLLVIWHRQPNDWWSTESLLPSETGWETLEANSGSIHDGKTLVTDSSKLRCYQMPIVHLLVLSLSWNTKKKHVALTADPTPTPGALPSLLSSPRHGHSLWIAMLILITGWLSNPFQRSLSRVMVDGNSYDFGHLRSVHHVAKVHPFQN